MWFSIREAKPNGQRVAVARHTVPEAARRPILIGVLVTVALLGLFAVQSLPSRAATASSTPATAVVVSSSGRSTAHHRSTHPRRSTAVSQRRLRGLVVRLSRCVARLSSGSQKMLLRRAGIGTARPSSRRAVARTLHMSLARETRREHAALRTLQRAARHQRCGSTPAWVHVPAGNRLVLVDPILTAVATSSTKVSFTPSATTTGSPLGSGLVHAWWRLVWMAARQS